MRRLISIGFIVLLLGLTTSARAGGTLRVCANPNDLPFSNRQGEGFENKLAQLLARDLGERVAYTWTEEHEHFIKKTINAGKCDVLLGVPTGFDEVDTTQPYYTSGYVFVSRKDHNLNLSSMRDPRLRALKIGVHVIGDDNTPPLEALARQGITQNIRGYMIFRDTQVKGHSRLIDDIAAGKVDVAAMWGPLAGYYAQHASAPLRVSPVADTASFAPVLFQYPIAVGVRKGNSRLREQLNAAIARHGSEIRKMLKRYGVPLLEPSPHAAG
ncbi:MAG: quinoprotein dehydrogenase-associated putative ABC transporter substrate-binding protein [Alphaproteobacteria bacterium]|nr:quinoprotein dehydrogenase-associated putative ABC transporter substrate-binding protein [Alphaproteobacteria bacterium]MBV9062825.1 quinoprotein dehydrogenase-associated putative ABC transporter substrate-binding protein [Alphaproteobacteria bacterium]